MSLERATLEHSTRVIYAHPPGQCAGQWCTLHNRSNHTMRKFPQVWRDDRGIMERMCEHGCGHPDPDDFKVNQNKSGVEGIHGCDGCCGNPVPLMPSAQPVEREEVAEVEASEITDVREPGQDDDDDMEFDIPRITILVESGCVVEVYSNEPDTVVEIIDLDTFDDKDQAVAVENAVLDLKEQVEQGIMNQVLFVEAEKD